MVKDPRVYVAASGKHVLDQMIPCFMTDPRQRLKASSFMILCQEMAMNSAEILGFGYESLNKENLAWVLSRMHFHFNRPVLWRENIQMQTWHKGVQGLFFIRDYQMVDSENDDVVAVGTSSWVVLDINSRTMVRMSDAPDVINHDPQLSLNAIEEQAAKVMIPRKVTPEFVKDYVVVASEIDINGHTNNVRYIDWAIDCVDPELLMTKDLTDVTINFNKETYLGNTVSFYRHVEEIEEDCIVTVEGKVEEKQSFCARMVFTSPKDNTK